MKTVIKSFHLFAACAAFSLASVLSAQDDPHSLPTKPDNPEPGATTKERMVSRGDQTFLEKAAKSGMKEVAVSQAVLPNLMTPEAREFAQRMIKDHTANNEELKMLAARKGVMLPPEDKALKLAEKWSEKTKNLDESYLKEMVSDHKEVIELFKKGAKADDPDIAAFAVNTLPTLQHHFEMARGHKMP